MLRTLMTVPKAVAVTAFLCLFVRTADAQDDVQRDVAAAEMAFEKARELTATGDYVAACPLFAESHRLDPGVGVLLFLGDCYEKIGKTASAWATYREAIPPARSSGQTVREERAVERVNALEPKLIRLRIVVPEAVAAVDGLEVRRGNQKQGRALWGAPVPIDPGHYVITADAPGRVPYTHELHLADAGTTQDVTIPMLALVAVTAPPPPPPPPRPDPAAVFATPMRSQANAWTGQHTAALMVGGVGVVGLAAGFILGALTFATWDDAQAHCERSGSPRRCSQKGVELTEDATTLGHASTAAFIVGGVGVITGVILWLTTPDTPERERGIKPAVVVTPTGASAGVGGVF